MGSKNELIKINRKISYYINWCDDSIIHVYSVAGEEIEDKYYLHITGVYKYTVGGRVHNIYGYYLSERLLLLIEEYNGFINSVWVTSEVKQFFSVCYGIYEATDKMLKILGKCYFMYMGEIIGKEIEDDTNLAVAVNMSVEEILKDKLWGCIRL